MAIIPPGYGQMTIPISHGDVSRDAAVVFGVDMNAQVGSVSLVNKILTDFTGEFAAVLDDAVTVGPGRLNVGQDGGESLVFIGSTTVVGTSAQASMPSNVAVLLRKTSSRGGRRGRGRMFIPWALSDAAVDDTGHILGGVIANLQTRATDFLNNLTLDLVGDLATPMVLLHTASGPEVENPTATGLPNEVTALTVDGLIGSQRRRLAR